MPSVSQILAVSYPAVLTENRKAQNQWEESALLREMERQKMIVRKSLGSQIEVPLDYQRNQGAGFLVTDLQATSLQKTEVLTDAVYDIAELCAPIVWSKKDEVMNPSENQKIALVASLVSNALDTHDDLIEQALFAVSTNGFLGLKTHIPDSVTGTSDGGIDPSTDTYWRNQSNTYVDDTDIESGMTLTWNQCAKGSGSKLSPTLVISDATTQALFEGTQQANQRYVDSDELKAGFKILAFKTSRYVFSQYGDTRQFFVNPKNFQLIVSKEYFRDRSDTQEMPNANGFVSKIYSALQLVTGNRSRLGVNHL